MANQHGGKRTPSKPAPASGPGALSRRTDGRPNVMSAPGGAYGDATDMQSLQTSAPMGAGAPTPAPAPVGGGVDPSGLVGLHEPTQRPNEPVTAGAAAGPGIGPQAAGLSQQDPRNAETMDRLRRYLPAMVEMANRPDATADFRHYVSLVRASLALGGPQQPTQ